MEADTEVLQRKTRETEAMRQRVSEMEEVKELMEQQVRDYTIYEVSEATTMETLQLWDKKYFLHQPSSSLITIF